MEYEKIKQVIKDSPFTYLPALTVFIIELSAYKGVFARKEALHRIVDKAWEKRKGGDNR